LRAGRSKKRRKVATPILSARLNDRITLETRDDGSIAAVLDGYPIEMGQFSAKAAERAHDLAAGLPLASFAKAGAINKEIDLLVQRLARSGLLEYRLARAGDDEDVVAIEPQTPDYWPRAPKLGASDTVALSRFAYLRRRGNAMVLESPLATALFRIGDATIAAALAGLVKPQKVSKLRQWEDFPGNELLALLLDCRILFRVEPGSEGLRPQEGDDDLVLWDFHDLLFHARSMEGRQANPLGGLYAHVGTVAPLPAVRPRWPGTAIDLSKFATPLPPIAGLFRARHSVRDFDEQQPITLAELAQFLEGTARVLSRWESALDFDGGGPVLDYTRRPYPSAGSAYELELYLAVANCEGLARGFYHYDADAHALVAIAVQPEQLESMLGAAQFALDAPGLPQVLVTVAARFGRLSWKYSAIAYSLILKDAGGLLQTFYLMAAEMGLGGCAVGTNNIELFAKMTGMEFHVEGPVGQFALGRGSKDEAAG
jgi:SagB-type dehydrogenase family enzyme